MKWCMYITDLTPSKRLCHHSFIIHLTTIRTKGCIMAFVSKVAFNIHTYIIIITVLTSALGTGDRSLKGFFHYQRRTWKSREREGRDCFPRFFLLPIRAPVLGYIVIYPLLFLGRENSCPSKEQWTLFITTWVFKLMTKVNKTYDSTLFMISEGCYT